MMATVLSLAGVDEVDFDAVGKAVSSCDRAVISRAVADDVTRHSGFLVQAYRDQRALAADRAALAERRRKLRVGEPSVDAEQTLVLAAQLLDDRQHALDDQRQLDREQQEVIGNFRQMYVAKCSGRAS